MAPLTLRCPLNPFTVKLGYNELGYNELGYNELGYNKHSVNYNEQIFWSQMSIYYTNQPGYNGPQL